MDNTKASQLNVLREKLFFVSLIFIVSVFPFSEALVSIAAGLLLAQALILRSWKHHSVNPKNIKIVLFPVSVFIVYLVGTVFTDDFSWALYELNKTVFWVILPLAVSLSPRLDIKKVYIVLLVFIFAVTVASLIILSKVLLNYNLDINEFRSLSIVSHIRFSLQVVLALILTGWFIFSKNLSYFPVNRIFLWGIVVWLSMFLILLKSLVGIIAFIGVIGIAFVLFIGWTENKRTKLAVAVLLIVALSVPIVYVSKVYYEYYDFEELDPAELEQNTLSGNPYHHDLDIKIRENGNLVYVYLCEDELRKEWNKRSEIKYDDDLNGYTLGSTLIRYLTSKGLRKDSVGVNKLTPQDVLMVEKGVTNYKFQNHVFSIYPRVYETIWELDYYKQTGDPTDKTLAQRIEFLKASSIIIKDHPAFGVGTGNWAAKYDNAYVKMNSQLNKEKRSSSHNQYVNYIVKFGILGLFWILFAVLHPVFQEGHGKNIVFILFLVIYGVANLGDANMETHMGLSFFTFFYSFFLWNSTPEMKSASA